MNIFVLLKQVPDTETKIRLTGDNSGIEQGDIKWIVSPYDEYAIEEGLKTKEALKAGTVTAVSVGPDRCVEALRTALAMGADNAIHVKTDAADLDTYLTSKALSEVLKKESPDLIFTGKQGVDDDQAAVFGYVAELLNIPAASVVVKVELEGDKKSLKAHREVEGGENERAEHDLAQRSREDLPHQRGPGGNDERHHAPSDENDSGDAQYEVVLFPVGVEHQPAEETT